MHIIILYPDPQVGTYYNPNPDLNVLDLVSLDPDPNFSQIYKNNPYPVYSLYRTGDFGYLDVEYPFATIFGPILNKSE